jgi:adenylate cyclase
MTVRFPIGTKILALAVFLLSLTVALSAFSAQQAREIRLELQEMAESYIPLDDMIESLALDGLRERLAFERWRASLSAPNSVSGILKEASTNYQAVTARVQEDFARVNTLLERFHAEPEDAEDVAKIRMLLKEVERNYPMSIRLEQQILEHQLKRNRAAANEVLAVYELVQQNLQTHRDELGALIERLNSRAASTAHAHEQRLMLVTSIATVSAILFGLLFSYLMTRRLVHPVRNLMAGVASVENGNLDVKVPVSSSDEIGVLTRSFNGMVDELRAKERIKETFGKYIDPRIVEHVILNPSAAEIEGGRREVTVSFCDLVGFTTIGENMTPSGLVRLLNRYFALMSEAIQQNKGVIDKFIGDAVMAFWAPPFCPSGEHADGACRAAIAELKALDTFRADLPELMGLRKNLPTIDVRVGLASGDVVVGNIGSENSRSYTVMGDTVNLASRLEGINRLYGTRILMNEHTRNLTRNVIEAREVDSIAVKGKTEAARVFEVLGLAGEVAEYLLRCRESYEAGLAEYRLRNWHAAELAFREGMAAAPGDGPSALLLERVAKLKAAPPNADWDGIWRFTEK